MTHPEVLRDQVEVIGFDVYDTLLPYEPKFNPAFEDFLEDKDYAGDPQAVYDGWKGKLFYYMNVNTIVNEPRSSIREAAHRGLKAYLEEIGVEYTDDEIRELVAVWKTLEPHPDVIPSFERLGEEYTLVGLSNGDPDLLEAVRPAFDGTLDGMMSSAEAGVFKPAPAAYEQLLERYDIAAHEGLYAAAHDFDITGPHHVGMHTCFVERVDPYGVWPIEPDLWVDDIAEMTDILLGE